MGIASVKGLGIEGIEDKELHFDMSQVVVGGPHNHAIQQPDYTYRVDNTTYGGIRIGGDWGSPYDQASFFVDPIVVELKLIDGSRLVDTFDRSRVYEIRSKTAEDGTEYSQFKYMNQRNQRCASDKEFNVACNIADLCYLLGISYRPFSKTILERVIKEGDPQ